MALLIGQNSEVNAIHGYSIEEIAYNLSLQTTRFPRARSKKDSN
jgi:hypothetical protein